MKENTVSILLSTYNGQKFLSDQLQSIINQTYTDWKLFIRDDGSTDDTLSIINQFKKEYPTKIKLYQDSFGNLGPKKSFEILCNNTIKSNYYAFCDQDDIWESNKLSVMLEHTEDLEVPILIISDLSIIDQEDIKIYSSFWKKNKICYEDINFNRLLSKNTSPGCSMLFNKKLLQLSLPIPTNAIMHDYWIILVASSIGKINIVNQTLTKYRIHDNNVLGPNQKGIFRRIIGIFYYIFFNKKYRNQISLNINQARELFKFKHLMPIPKQKFLDIYLSLGSSTWVKRKYLVLKNCIKKGHFTENIEFIINV